MSAREGATVTAKIDPALKREAETILRSKGLSPSEFLTLAYRRIVERRELPFDDMARGGPADTLSKRNQGREREIAAVLERAREVGRGKRIPGRDSTDVLREIRSTWADRLAPRPSKASE